MSIYVPSPSSFILTFDCSAVAHVGHYSSTFCKRALRMSRKGGRLEVVHLDKQLALFIEGDNEQRKRWLTCTEQNTITKRKY